MRPGILTSTAVALTCLAGTVHGQTSNPLQGHAMLGVNRATGELSRFNFATLQPQTIGTVHNADNQALTGIEAAAYIPGFQNLYAFWHAPDGQARLIYVDIETAYAATVGSPLGTGSITGAVAVPNPEHDADASSPWAVFAVQQATPDSTDGAFRTLTGELQGRINTNPNNSHHNSFRLTTPDGTVISRDELHQQSNIDKDGVLYNGPATHIRLLPKGNGNRNYLTINGEAYPLRNGTTYNITAEGLTVRVYNDKPQNGKAMGHWWIEIGPGVGSLIEPLHVDPNNHRLVRIDHQQGHTQTVMNLSRAYDSLASQDGRTFYATSGGQLYKIDAGAATETVVSTGKDQTLGLEFAGDILVGFEVVGDQLLLLNAETGQLLFQPARPASLSNMGSIVFVPAPVDPAARPASFD